MSTPLRVAVVGVGHLGRHHARILASLPGAALAGVVDVNEARAGEVAAQYGARAFTRAEDVTGPYDVVARAESDDLDGLAKGTVMPMQELDGITRTLTCPVIQL